MISPSEQPRQAADAAAARPENLLIRRMKNADVDGVMEIESVSFGRHHWSDESFYNEIKNQLGRYYSLIDEDSGKLMGYCGFWVIMDEAHVTTIAVRPEYRKHSLGELQLVHLIDKCMGMSIHWVTLEVRVSNYGAQNLYYKYGFNSMGTRPRYYQDNNEDALIMTTPDISGEEFRTLFRKNKAELQERVGKLLKGSGD